jgi:hypothetical protein
MHRFDMLNLEDGLRLRLETFYNLTIHVHTGTL